MPPDTCVVPVEVFVPVKIQVPDASFINCAVPEIVPVIVTVRATEFVSKVVKVKGPPLREIELFIVTEAPERGQRHFGWGSFDCWQ